MCPALSCCHFLPTSFCLSVTSTPTGRNLVSTVHQPFVLNSSTPVCKYTLSELLTRGFLFQRTQKILCGLVASLHRLQTESAPCNLCTCPALSSLISNLVSQEDLFLVISTFTLVRISKAKLREEMNVEISALLSTTRL